MSSLPARMKKIQSKTLALECSKDFSHYKSMGIFPDAQGQLTPQSLVRSSRISNSSEMLWIFLLPASMKKIRSKMKALEWTQHFPHYNSMVAMETSGRIWPNFELIQALIHVLITCKYEKNPIKNLIKLTVCSFCIMSFFVISVVFHFGFEGETVALIKIVPRISIFCSTYMYISSLVQPQYAVCA